MRDLKRAAELDPNRAEYHLYVAWAANQSSPPDFSLAGREIDKALAIDTLNADAYWQRGVMEHALGAIEDSLRDLRHALELKPTRIEAYATMAEDYEEKNDASAALAAWQKATAGATSNPYWHYKYGRLLLERGRTADAVKHLGLAAMDGGRLQPRPGWIAPAEFKLAEALRKSGKKQDAIEHYNAFLSMPTAINSPDRVDALQTRRALGAPWQPPQ
jgi:tetratricopeptide (TPR) repeat protein